LVSAGSKQQIRGPLHADEVLVAGVEPALGPVQVSVSAEDGFAAQDAPGAGGNFGAAGDEAAVDGVASGGQVSVNGSVV